MRVFIIGSGTFGTAIANQLACNPNNDVVIFSRSENKKNEINNFHTNKKYFGDIILNKSLSCTNIYSDIDNADVIFVALPSSVLQQNIKFFAKYISNEQIVVNLSKGILNNGNTVFDHLKNLLKSENVVTLKGPSFAAEIMLGSQTILTLGYSTKYQKEIINKIFKKTCINLESTRDIVGVEILGIIKNMYAILIGYTEEYYGSVNTRFMIISKVFKEIKTLNSSFGGDIETLFLSCGLGDICLTSFNDLSRNRSLGEAIGKGVYSSIENKNMIVEGVNSIKVISSIIKPSTLSKTPLLRKLSLFFDRKLDKFELDLNSLI